MSKSTIECRVCGTKHTYCAACAIKPNIYLENGFCNEDCFKVWETLSYNGCKLATANETLDALAKLNVPDNLVPGIKDHISTLKKEVASVKEMPNAKAQLFAGNAKK